MFNTDSSSFDISISIQTGNLKIFVGKTKDFREKDAIYHEEVDSSKETYKYLKIKPSDFDFNSAHDYFIILKNPSTEPVVLNITIIQNNVRVEL